LNTKIAKLDQLKTVSEPMLPSSVDGG